MSDLENKIAETRQKCWDALKGSELSPVHEKLPMQGDDCKALKLVFASANRQETLSRIAHERGVAVEQASNPTFALERTLLVRAALQSLDRVSSQPVEESVKWMLCDYYKFFAKPAVREMQLFQPNDYSFLALAKIALLERFPAGQFDWEVSGLPRSWLFKVPITSLPKVVYFVARHLGGFAPYMAPHMAYRKRNPLMARGLIPVECEKSWYRMVLSAEQQPAIRGMILSSWLFSPDTYRVSPHLSFLMKPFLESGGLHTTQGRAEVDGGFSEGSEFRKKLNDSGEFSPTIGLVLWSREQMIKWAHSHPELKGL